MERVLFVLNTGETSPPYYSDAEKIAWEKTGLSLEN